MPLVVPSACTMAVAWRPVTWQDTLVAWGLAVPRNCATRRCRTTRHACGARRRGLPIPTLVQPLGQVAISMPACCTAYSPRAAYGTAVHAMASLWQHFNVSHGTSGSFVLVCMRRAARGSSGQATVTAAAAVMVSTTCGAHQHANGCRTAAHSQSRVPPRSAPQGLQPSSSIAA